MNTESCCITPHFALCQGAAGSALTGEYASSLSVILPKVAHLTLFDVWIWKNVLDEQKRMFQNIWFNCCLGKNYLYILAKHRLDKNGPVFKRETCTLEFGCQLNASIFPEQNKRILNFEIIILRNGYEIFYQSKVTVSVLLGCFNSELVTRDYRYDIIVTTIILTSFLFPDF